MTNPWLSIPLSDYEQHMNAPSVQQAQLLALTLQELVRSYSPASLAILGAAGGNGLEGLPEMGVRRAVAVDINASYLEAARSRYDSRFEVFETIQHDLSTGRPPFESVDLVVGSLVLEYIDVERFLEYAHTLTTAKGVLALAFQNREDGQATVTPTGINSLTTLERIHAYPSVARISSALLEREYELDRQETLRSNPGKSFTLLVHRKW